MKKNYIFHLLLSQVILLIILILSCTNNQKQPIKTTPAFYYWQTNFDLSKTEKKYLTIFSVKKIYPKFFDVDWNFNKKEATALATLEISTDLATNFEIIPTVFITNRTLINISIENLSDLASKISKKLIHQMAAFKNQTINQIQFDCDWSQSTKEKYFQLLKLLKKEFEIKGIDLSATIRLHQIKYAQKTGIPPVKRGILMYYNMGEVQNITAKNSILDNQIGRRYMDKLINYPLPLDIALPLFQWGVLFRNGKMIKLINQLKESKLTDNQHFIRTNKNTWEVRKNTYLDGYYLYKSDHIRLERINLGQLKIAASLLNNHLKKESRSIIFYHLDSVVLANFEVTDLQEILTVFEKN